MSPSAAPIDEALPNADSARLADSLLSLYADVLDDFERTRIATENRARSLAGLAAGATPEVLRLEGLVKALKALEHGANLELKRAMRKHPLGQWVKRTVGVGEKQGARLLAAIGDPYWHSRGLQPGVRAMGLSAPTRLAPDGRPRTVSELDVKAAVGPESQYDGGWAANAQTLDVGADVRDIIDQRRTEAQSRFVGGVGRPIQRPAGQRDRNRR